MQAKANGITINYTVDGAQGDWLVLSNSLATNLSMWDAQMREFSGSFRVLRYDQRGHGKTNAPPGRYSFDTLIADALGLMDALRIERADFCGLSMGGATAPGACATPSGPRCTRDCLRFGVRFDAAERAAVGGTHRGRAAGRHGAAGRADGRALVSA
jgi:pimeloyl-ACP methyl ester carboxylesterase